MLIAVSKFMLPVEVSQQRLAKRNVQFKALPSITQIRTTFKLNSSPPSFIVKLALGDTLESFELPRIS